MKMPSEHQELAVVSVPSAWIDEANQAHTDATLLFASSVERAMKCGEVLARIRTLFPARAAKGQGFETWIEEHFPFTGRKARQYIRLYEHRDLVNIDAGMKDNLRMLSTPKTIPEPGFRNDDDDTVQDVTNEIQAVWTATPGAKPLEPADERKAQELAVFFNVDVAKARQWVQAKKKGKSTPKRAKDKTKLVAVTIRFEPDEVDVMESVARAESKRLGKIVPLAVIAREHHRLGSARFAKKYLATQAPPPPRKKPR
jgi:hypothetical protein